MPNNTQKLIEEAVQRFNKEKKNFEIYGSLGMGIAYPKLEDFLRKELNTIANKSADGFIQSLENAKTSHGTWCGGWHDMDNFEFDSCEGCQSIIEYKDRVISMLKQKE